jgi:hypothetical protein
VFSNTIQNAVFRTKNSQPIGSTYIFGAVCPKEGKGAALILPACNTEAMNLHLAEIAADRRSHGGWEKTPPGGVRRGQVGRKCP